MEQASQNKIEQEIADLTKQIESKRRTLEAGKGIIEEKELVREAVGERIVSSVPSFALAKKTAPAVKGGSNANVSYLDSVDEETTEIVNSLLGIVFSKGISEAVKEAEKHEPFVMDAFHDALTDKMYDKLKEGGIVK